MSFGNESPGLSATPLAALDLIVIDTETTGLQVAQDRVIEIGAVRFRDGQPTQDTFATTVNPGIALPEAARKITGITEADLAGAPAFPAAMAKFAAWADTPVVVGYSVGFDIAILAREHDRHGRAWVAPRSLDVLHLVEVLKPQLPDTSLETIAAWLGVDTQGRHRALADARIAAAILAALIPLLRARGIATLAQAERVTAVHSDRNAGEARVGWAGPRMPDTGVTSFARIDSFPYRHRAGDLMSAPPRWIAPTATLSMALAQMVRTATSSAVIASDGVDGILTERDILRAIDADGPGALERKVTDYASFPLVTIDSDEFAYRALALLRRHGFRHLGVTGPDRALAGILTSRDLLTQRADEAVSLGDRIHDAGTAAALGRIWADLVTVTRALLGEGVEAPLVATIISTELRSLTRRAAELAEAAHGPVPGGYGIFVLGSAGRGESLLAMDQDNAIVFADGIDPARAEAAFARVGTAIADTLNVAGVPYCKGGIMASRPDWRMSRHAWSGRVAGWLAGAKPEDFLHADIFFDARHVHGDALLTDGLLAEARAAAAQAEIFLKFLGLNAARFRSALGMFGRIRTSDGRVDLKMSGTLPINGAARTLALRHGVADLATPARLAALAQAGHCPARLATNLTDAHRIFLSLILEQQLRDLPRGIAASSRVAPNEFSRHQRNELTWALEQTAAVSDLLGVPPT